MPPRITGTRVTHVMVDGHGKKQPINPSPGHAGFHTVQQSVARRQKVSMGSAGSFLKAGAQRARTGGGHAGHGG